jgi:hypothetical protein
MLGDAVTNQYRPRPFDKPFPNPGPVLSIRVPVRLLRTCCVRAPDPTRLVIVIASSRSLRHLCASSFKSSFKGHEGLTYRKLIQHA